MRVLEVGPDSLNLCRDLVARAGVEYAFADFTNARPGEPGFTPMGGEYAIDCPDGAFDIVYSANVIEHVRKVWHCPRASSSAPSRPPSPTRTSTRSGRNNAA